MDEDKQTNRKDKKGQGDNNGNRNHLKEEPLAKNQCTNQTANKKNPQAPLQSTHLNITPVALACASSLSSSFSSDNQSLPAYGNAEDRAHNLYVKSEGESSHSPSPSPVPGSGATLSITSSSGTYTFSDLEKLPQSSNAAHGHGNAQYNWQASKTTLKERLAYLFNTEIMSDIHFLVGTQPSQQKIPAHKFVLSVGSAVFDAQFNGPLATHEEIIEIPDVEPGAFLALLKFLYSDEVHICSDTVMTTLYTAKKYAVPALEKACVEFLKRNLGSDNAFMLLTQARLFDEPQLAALCLETIDKNTSEALMADGFTDIDSDTLCVVLERDTLGIRESKLFAAVCRWAEAECARKSMPPTTENQRTVLHRALRLIRFPLMSVEEFAQGAAQSGLLEDREVVQLFLYFTVNPKPQIGFLDKPRCCLTGKEQIVSRFCQIESRWGYSGTSDRIRYVNIYY